MGLDISAYSGLKPAAAKGGDEDLTFHIHDQWKERAGSIVDGQAYAASESYRFRAGSYFGYNDWRENLAEMAGYEPIKHGDNRHDHSRGAWESDGGPFYELIDFTDCDGVIGSEVAEKLARDFLQHQTAMAKFAEKRLQVFERERFVETYKNFQKAFELAAKGGAVVFC